MLDDPHVSFNNNEDFIPFTSLLDKVLEEQGMLSTSQPVIETKGFMMKLGHAKGKGALKHGIQEVFSSSPTSVVFQINKKDINVDNIISSGIENRRFDNFYNLGLPSHVVEGS